MRDLHARKDGEEDPAVANLRSPVPVEDQLSTRARGRMTMSCIHFPLAALHQGNRTLQRQTLLLHKIQMHYFSAVLRMTVMRIWIISTMRILRHYWLQKEKAGKTNESGKAPAPPEPMRDEFKDYLEAMGDLGSNGTNNAPLRAPPPALPEDDFDEEMEVVVRGLGGRGEGG